MEPGMAEPGSWHTLQQQIQELLAAGGPVLLVIIALSVLALAIILLKTGQFLRLGLRNTGFISPVLAAAGVGQTDRALSLLAATRHPIARTLEVALVGREACLLDRRDLAEDVARDGAVRLAALRGNLRLLELIAALSPLLGLLGTVLGMIDAFQALEAAGNRVNPAILSGGIWEALLTTAAGLVVAIPAAAAYNIYEGIVERVAQTLEDAATQLLLGVPTADLSAARPVVGMAS